MCHLKQLVMRNLMLTSITFSSVSAQGGGGPVWMASGQSLGAGAAAWSYDNSATGPENWPELGYTQCGGDKQSPINIDTAKLHKYEYNDLIIFEHYKDLPSKLKVTNNGNTLVATFDYEPAAWRPTVSGGQLSGTYAFEQLHFHWGLGDQKQQSGSEHTISGVRAPLEMHMVHRNVKYKTLSEAVNRTDGLLVLATLFEMNTNVVMPLLVSVQSVAELVIPFNGSATLKPRPLASVLPHDTTAFFRYRGSLTTPGCQQSVDWVVFEHSAHVIVGQMLVLQKLLRKNGERNLHNFRPIQKLNRRKVDHMIYKRPGAVVVQSSAPAWPRPLPAVSGVPLAVTVLWALSWI